MKEGIAIAVFGARKTGKTSWVRQHLKAEAPSRLAVWDHKHDPALKDLGTAYTDWRAFVRAMKADQFQIRYLPDFEQPMDGQFEIFCKACILAGDLEMFVDELPEVTKANRAPPAWRFCVNVGRSYTNPRTGSTSTIGIIGAGQRAAECDKSFISNAEIIHCGRLAHVDDAVAMAKSLNCTAKELMALPNLHYVERRAGQIEPTRGELSFNTHTVTKKVAAAAKTPKKPALRKPTL